MPDKQLPSTIPSNAIEVLQRLPQKDFFGGGMPPMINMQFNGFSPGGGGNSFDGVLPRLDTIIELLQESVTWLRGIMGAIGALNITQPGQPGEPGPRHPGQSPTSGFGRITNLLSAIGAGGGSTGGTGMALLMNAGRTNPLAAVAVASIQAATALAQVGQASQRAAFEIGQFSPAMRAIQAYSQFRGVTRSFREGQALAPDTFKLTQAVENLRDTVQATLRPFRQFEMRLETLLAKEFNQFLKGLSEALGIKPETINDVAADRQLQFVAAFLERGDREKFLTRAAANMDAARANVVNGGKFPFAEGVKAIQNNPGVIGEQLVNPGFWDAFFGGFFGQGIPRQRAIMRQFGVGF